MSSGGEESAAVLPLHAVVPGRLRVRVRGLHRSPALRRALEGRLRRHAQIRSVTASEWSGNLVVHFEPSTDHNSVLALVETAATAEGEGGLNSNSDACEPLDHLAPAWHAQSTDAVIAAVGSSREGGLSADEAQHRLHSEGLNALAAVAGRPAWAIFAEQFNSLPVGLLLASSAISLFTGGLADAAMILSIVVINAVIGSTTEAAAERTINALGTLVRPSALVIRDGHVQEIASENVVFGDLLVLLPGTIVAADSRVLEARDLSVDESALTGESMPVPKRSDTVSGAGSIPIGDRHNLVYKGTNVTGGNGVAVVVGTGRNSEIARIQAMVEGARAPQTLLHRQLQRLGARLAWLSGAACLLVFSLGLLRGYGFVTMLRMAASLAVAAVPEGLPMVSTTTLAIGVRKMRARHVLVRHLAAIETLGAVRSICFDKTGTLTLNRMCVSDLACGGESMRMRDAVLLAENGNAVDPGSRHDLRRMLEVLVLCNDAEVLTGNADKDEAKTNRNSMRGSSTERALVDLAIACGIDVEAVRVSFPRLGVVHRTERRALMITLHAMREGGRLLAVKGAPNEVLRLCRMQLAPDGQERPMADIDRRWFETENIRMASAALRVLGCAYAKDADADRNGSLIWLGLVGMSDPPRHGTRELVRLFQRAGIDTVMLTGDQPATARAIAEQLGLARDGDIELIDATQLEEVVARMPDVAKRADVFARISPSHKLRIVRALQKGGSIVAMTGDGVNDSPALKAADIGVAMGRSGTDVAREVADIVLEDDDLHGMLVAVQEGRTIYVNIRKSLHYLLSTNLSEINMALAATALGMGQPLTPVQLLWINLMTDVLPGLALALEDPESDVMSEPPRDPDQPIVTRSDGRHLAIEGTLIAAGSFGVYLAGLSRHGQTPTARTMGFLSLITAQLLHAWSCRSDKPLFSGAVLPRNPYFGPAMIGTLLVQIGAVLLPPLRRFLGFGPLGTTDALITIAGGLLPTAVIESCKSANGTEYEPPSAAPSPNKRSSAPVRPAPELPVSSDRPRSQAGHSPQSAQSQRSRKRRDRKTPIWPRRDSPLPTS